MEFDLYTCYITDCYGDEVLECIIQGITREFYTVRSTMNIHKTTNGGVNYTLQSSGWTAQRFMTIWTLSADTVMMAGNYGKMIKTVNGGNNWITVYADTTLQFWGLWFTNPQTGYVAGSNGRIMKTTNRGDNWTIPYYANSNRTRWNLVCE